MIQRALMQYRDPKNRKLILEGLKSAGRTDLIGNGRQFLIPAGSRDTNQYALKHRKSEKRN
jgi:hypothetical protein